ncbi:MAG: hypothetical protein ABI667_08385 [Sphingomicrobium sp.]
MFGTDSRVPKLAILLLMGLGLAILIVRYEAVRAPASHPIASLAKFFPGHPDMIRRDLEVSAAVAGREGRALSDADLEKSRKLLKMSPLATMPLMIAGAEAQLGGDAAKAQMLYLAARTRNPRLPAVRLLLADSYLRQDNAKGGIEELLALTRITPRSSGPATSALVEYARDPVSARRLGQALEPYPDMRAGILTQLARDSKNLASVMALAPAHAQERPWESVLLDAMVQQGEYARAFELWRQWSKTDYAPGAVSNPTFEEWSAPGPFNWQLVNSAGGLAEFREDAGVAIVYYGRDNITFLRQLLLLKPGEHRIRTSVSTSDIGGLRWSLRCADGRAVDEWKITDTQSVEIPGDCGAQWLELIGRPTETPVTREVILTRVGLA